MLLIDLDAQRSASVWLGLSREEDGTNLMDALLGEEILANLVQKTAVKGVDLVPPSSYLMAADRKLAGKFGAETNLKECISELPNSWDYILLNCPPNLQILTASALIAADDILITARPNTLDLLMLRQLDQNIQKVKSKFNQELRICGVLVCQADMRTRGSREGIGHLRKHYGNLVFDTVIRVNTRLGECPSWGKPITLYDPKCSGTEDYRAAAKEFVRRINSSGT